MDKGCAIQHYTPTSFVQKQIWQHTSCNKKQVVEIQSLLLTWVDKPVWLETNAEWLLAGFHSSVRLLCLIAQRLHLFPWSSVCFCPSLPACVCTAGASPTVCFSISALSLVLLLTKWQHTFLLCHYTQGPIHIQRHSAAQTGTWNFAGAGRNETGGWITFRKFSYLLELK